MSSNNSGKNKPNQNRVGIPVGTSKPRPTPPADAAGQPTPPPTPAAKPYDPNAPLPTPRPRRLDRTERIREVAKGETSAEPPVRRSAVGAGRTGASSKRAQGVATPSAASRAAAARAARRRTNNQIRIGLVILAILVVGTVIAVGVLGGSSTTTTTALAPADLTATVVAGNTGQISPTTVISAAIKPTITPTSAPTIPYPGGVPPTAAPIMSSTNTTTGPIAINVTKGIPDKTMTIVTNRGTIVLDLFSNAAPNTVKNYETRANRGEYNGRKFHRAEDWVLQGNDPKGDGSGGGDIPTEINKLPFSVGSLGVARTNAITNSNDSQFFIVKSADPVKYQNFTFLNGTFDANGVPTGGYTNFGQVVSGQDIVDKMQIGDVIYTIKVTDGAAPTPAAAPVTPTNASMTGASTVTTTGTLTGTATISSTPTVGSTATVGNAGTSTAPATVSTPTAVSTTAVSTPTVVSNATVTSSDTVTPLPSPTK